MPRKRSLLLLLSALFPVLPGAAGAQAAWESPTLLGPGTPGGVGVYLIEPEPGDDAGALVTWRSRPVPGGLGFRAGIADGADGDLSAFGGVDATGALFRSSPDFPLDAVWMIGGGLGVGDHILVSFPAGVSFGRTFQEDGTRFTPYAAPRVSLDARMGQDAPPGADDDELDLAVSVEVGFDVWFGAGLALRFGASLGDHEAVAVGIAFPGAG